MRTNFYKTFSGRTLKYLLVFKVHPKTVLEHFTFQSFHKGKSPHAFKFSPGCISAQQTKNTSWVEFILILFGRIRQKGSVWANNETILDF